MAKGITATIFLLAALGTACSSSSPDKSETSKAPKFRIDPHEVVLEVGAEQLFVAETPEGQPVDVLWSVKGPNGGSIDASGLYRAPWEAATATIVAASVDDPTLQATATVTVQEVDGPIRLTVEPSSARVSVGGTLRLVSRVTGTTNRKVSWSVLEADRGTIDDEGTFTAPNAAGSSTVRAMSAEDTAVSVDVPIEVVDGVAVTISPSSVALSQGGRQRFTATVTGAEVRDVDWSVKESNGGSIDGNGNYTAPRLDGTFTVVATSRADPERSGTATVVVRAPIEVTVTPRDVQIAPQGQVQFTASVSGSTETGVSWSVDEEDGGSVSAAGLYTAPAREGTFRVRARSVADPSKSGTGVVVVSTPNPIDLSVLPEDRRTTWSPGIPGGIPSSREVFATLTGLVADGTGDNSSAIQQAIDGAGAAYLSTGVLQEVVLPAGTFRFTNSISLNRSGVVLRGEGMGKTRLRYDGNGAAIVIARNRFGTYGSSHGPWFLAQDAVKGSRQIDLSASDAAKIEVGDILCIDEEDDPTFVRMGNARFEKRQPSVSADTHGPGLRAPDLWRSVTSMIRVTGKTVNGDQAVLALADPLHMSFRTSRFAQVFEIATEYSAARPAHEGVHRVGLESFYVTGGPIITNNVAFSWIDGLEVDGNPGTPNIGSYVNQGGITGRSVDLFHAYRFVVRNSYIHHSRNINQGGGAYLLSISSYTSESLIENNIVVFGNKPIVGNMMGGGNVIAYNYVDNARTDHPGWQEGAIDLNHQSFTHNALVEGNWSTNVTADTTHGNAGWHVFFRNYATGQNSAPLYGPYPYSSGSPDDGFRRAAGTDGYHRESTFIGNVLFAGTGTGVYQVDHTTGHLLSAPAVWRIGWGLDGGGDNVDDGTSLRLMYRHGNWDSVTKQVDWDEDNRRDLPPSLYLESKPSFFGELEWPWVDPSGATPSERLKVLPAKARYDALTAE